MKLGIFTRGPNAYAPLRLKKEAEKLGLEAEIIAYADLDFKITDENISVFLNGKILSNYDLIIFRSSEERFFSQRAFLLSFFENRKAGILNKSTYQKWSRFDKLTQHFLFQKIGLPLIVTESFGSKKRLIKNFSSFPKIVKSYFGSHGENVFKIKYHRDLAKVLAKHLAETLLVQPFLKAGEDIRVIVLGGKAIGAMKRIARSGSYLTNYSAGGRVENYSLEEDLEARILSEKAAKVCFLDYGGVDLMKDNQGQWRILEVNRACQFEGFEKATGINIARKIIEYLVI